MGDVGPLSHTGVEEPGARGAAAHTGAGAPGRPGEGGAAVVHSPHSGGLTRGPGGEVWLNGESEVWGHTHLCSDRASAVTRDLLRVRP